MAGMGIPVGSQGATLDQQYGGVPYGRAVGYNYGVPAPQFGEENDAEAVVHEGHSCSETTKKGTACKAPPAKGTNLCIGHLRSASTKES
jgi:hypothetical protein